MPRLSDTEEHKERNRRYQREWYARNRELQKSRVKANSDRYKAEIREYINSLKENGCSRCSEDHIATLDFHHLDPSEKEIGLNQAIRRKWSLEKIKGELEKCIILCSNCHRKLHYEEKL
jgi:hypothetical protein